MQPQSRPWVSASRSRKSHRWTNGRVFRGHLLYGIVADPDAPRPDRGGEGDLASMPSQGVRSNKEIFVRRNGRDFPVIGRRALQAPARQTKAARSSDAASPAPGRNWHQFGSERHGDGGRDRRPMPLPTRTVPPVARVRSPEADSDDWLAANACRKSRKWREKSDAFRLHAATSDKVCGRRITILLLTPGRSLPANRPPSAEYLGTTYSICSTLLLPAESREPTRDAITFIASRYCRRRRQHAGCRNCGGCVLR